MLGVEGFIHTIISQNVSYLACVDGITNRHISKIFLHSVLGFDGSFNSFKYSVADNSIFSVESLAPQKSEPVTPVYLDVTSLVEKHGSSTFGCMFERPRVYAIRIVDMPYLLAAANELKLPVLETISDDTFCFGISNDIFAVSWNVKMFKVGDWMILRATGNDLDVFQEEKWSTLPAPLCLAYKCYNRSAMALTSIAIPAFVEKLPLKTLYTTDRYSYDETSPTTCPFYELKKSNV